MDELTKHLVVVQGPSAGARLVVTDAVKLIGRGHGADLMLDDRAVSRRHFHAVVHDEGVHLQVCDGARPLLHGGREVREIIVAIGESVVVGHTVLLVEGVRSPEAQQRPVVESSTTVHSLLSGVAADVQGLSVIFSLNDKLSKLSTAQAVESALGSWANECALCERVEIAAADDEAASSTHETAVVTKAGPNGGTVILVPAFGTPSSSISFTTKMPPDRISDSLRRILVIAGALCGARIAQLSLLHEAREDGEFFRRQAIGSAHKFLGSSPAARELVRVIPKLAASEVTVLLLGETGVGKSFVARLIHETGPRSGHPFRVVNCASIPESLIESELFGHDRGAFTGAVTTQPGVFETAGRGTVFLDEIGELPLASQAKLLHALEDKHFNRLGSNRSLSLQARVIAATNRDLEGMVAAGTFRSDLFFRVAVVSEVVAPLRERADDLQLLAERILADLVPSAGRRIEGFATEALAAIRGYAWPGNVRELRNAIERAVVMGEGPWIVLADLPPVIRGRLEPSSKDDPFVVRLPARLEWLEQRAIEAALHETQGNQTKAAALLGINRHTLASKRRGGDK